MPSKPRSGPSLNDVLAALPGDFIDRLYAELPPSIAERALRGMRARRPITFRVNPLRPAAATVDAELLAAGVETAAVPWYRWARIVRTPGVHEGQLARLPAYQQGRLYLQSLSSMLPPLLLQPQPGERVLDIAAAPGSKTTQMAAMMHNKGRIVACELNPIRAGRLRHNVEVQGAQASVEVVMTDGAQFARQHPTEFDRVLVDVPCSGEGLFVHGEPDTYRHWSTRMVSRLSQTQHKLLAAGWQALRPGGLLVYSTCTLSLAENEEVIAWALRKWSDQAQLEPARLPPEQGVNGGGDEGADDAHDDGAISALADAVGDAQEGRVSDAHDGGAAAAETPAPGPLLTEILPDALPALGLEDTLGPGLAFVSAGLRRAVRVLPSELMEGFFLAALRKRPK